MRYRIELYCGGELARRFVVPGPVAVRNNSALFIDGVRPHYVWLRWGTEETFLPFYNVSQVKIETLCPKPLQ